MLIEINISPNYKWPNGRNIKWNGHTLATSGFNPQLWQVRLAICHTFSDLISLSDTFTYFINHFKRSWTVIFYFDSFYFYKENSSQLHKLLQKIHSLHVPSGGWVGQRWFKSTISTLAYDSNHVTFQRIHYVLIISI